MCIFTRLLHVMQARKCVFMFCGRVFATFHDDLKDLNSLTYAVSKDLINLSLFQQLNIEY